MKACPHCAVHLFDDQDFCYECMQPVIDTPEVLPPSADSEEQMIRIDVLVEDRFAYEAHFRKEEGALLRVGRARENTIVIPRSEIAEHQLDIFFSQGYLWVETKGSASFTQLNGMPLEGIRSLLPGARIELCGAHLSFPATIHR